MMNQLRTSQNPPKKLVLIVLLFLICATTNVNTQGLKIDNQLVSAKNDCFERIALGAMLPFEKTFRNADTNSLNVCKELCTREGEKCITIAFGIHARGNGTCQLSSEQIDTTFSRPPGTIFDPNFDLYGRKQNCFEVEPDTNSVTPGIFENTPQMDNGRPQSPFMPVGSTMENLAPQSTSSFAPSPTLSNDPVRTTDDRFTPRPYQTDITYDRPISSSNGYDVTENDGVRPTYSSYPMRSPNLPYDNKETNAPSYDQNVSNYNSQNRDKIYFSHDISPLYKYPMLYEQNYPSPNNDSYPRIYAQDAPTVENRYRPPAYGNDDPNQVRPTISARPVYGLGYGNGYSYGVPVKYGSNTRPTSSADFDTNIYGQNTSPTSPYNNNYGSNRPSSPSYGNNGRPEYSPSRPEYGSDNPRPKPSLPSYGNNERPDYSQDNRPLQPTYNNGGPQSSHPPDYNSQNRPNRPPNSNDNGRPDTEYAHRPDPMYNINDRPSSPNNGYGPSQPRPTLNSGNNYDENQRPGNGYASPDQGNTRPGTTSMEGNYHGAGEPIETYFNPDDYYPFSGKLSPDGYSGGNRNRNRNHDYNGGPSNHTSLKYTIIPTKI